MQPPTYLDTLVRDPVQQLGLKIAPDELEQFAATDPRIATLLSDERFCREYYNLRVPFDLQLQEPLGVSFCQVVRALPDILARLATIQEMVMRWERCVVPGKDELNRFVNTAQFGQCLSWSTSQNSLTILLDRGADHAYLLSPWDSANPYIRLQLRLLRDGRQGPSIVQRVGEWRVPLQQLRSLLVALIATRGHLFENTENYRIAYIQSIPRTRVQMEQREIISERARSRQAIRELPFSEGDVE